MIYISSPTFYRPLYDSGDRKAHLCLIQDTLSEDEFLDEDEFDLDRGSDGRVSRRELYSLERLLERATCFFFSIVLHTYIFIDV